MPFYTSWHPENLINGIKCMKIEKIFCSYCWNGMVYDMDLTELIINHHNIPSTVLACHRVVELQIIVYVYVHCMFAQSFRVAVVFAYDYD